uniref:S-adenosylmethionine mitochondrial carrier protein n=1 Tax=Panagrolaimus superbus TaxID=310955 RepID=A0A914ZAZ1_9BILA
MPEGIDVLHKTFAGGVAGFSVDVVLFPLDTIKTRLQSQQGFHAAGGSKNLYRGLSSVALGSAPTGAIFFLIYSNLKEIITVKPTILGDAICACSAEFVSSTIGVPIEVIKQRSQTGHVTTPFLQLGKKIYKREGFAGLYRGLVPTLAREMPFSFIELPIWEYFKREYPKWTGRQKCTPFESAVCGSSAGCFAAIITTPLDVIKTRVMLSEIPLSSYNAFLHIQQHEGISKLFSGAIPRTLWMGFGGFVFFFAYELSMSLSHRLF